MRISRTMVMAVIIWDCLTIILLFAKKAFLEVSPWGVGVAYSVALNWACLFAAVGTTMLAIRAIRILNHHDEKAIDNE